MSKKVLLIIPSFNEGENLRDTIKIVENSGFDYLIVNDGSSDNTEDILRETEANHVNLAYNLGIGGAMQTGYKYALAKKYDIAVQFDADGQHDINCVDSIIEPIIKNEADLVIGSRFVDKTKTNFRSTAMRRVGIRAISGLIFALSKKRILDTTSGFRAANKTVIKKFAKNYPLEYPEPISDFELVKHGLRIKEVPVNMKKRACGKSSIRAWKNGYYMINVFLAILMVRLRSSNESEY